MIYFLLVNLEVSFYILSVYHSCNVLDSQNRKLKTHSDCTANTKTFSLYKFGDDVDIRFIMIKWPSLLRQLNIFNKQNVTVLVFTT